MPSKPKTSSSPSRPDSSNPQSCYHRSTGVHAMKTGQLLLRMLDEAYKTRTWHGPNLRQSLRGISARQAAWRPGPRRHNIWEETLHAAYWKYVVRRRITGEKRGAFP